MRPPATIGARVYEQEPLGFYPTPPCLLSVLPIQAAPTAAIWECAAGDGRLADKVTELAGNAAAGRTVLTDLEPRRADIQPRDFLQPDLQPPPGGPVHIIITNPPFDRLEAFIERGLEHIAAGHARDVILLARHEADTTASRRHLFSAAAHRLVCCWRPKLIPGTKGNGRFTFDWWRWSRDRGPGLLTSYSTIPAIAIRRNPLP